ncbi:hypothetical protein GOP47_0023176 [Adiantum capillus-veneris]|uniref:Uncharacterized protein n=1 Tax=Adiantum capillus-veneris TaxID=13818 RepID=A0A9D4U7W3_ADICA|nr:hypothetical protein GOP47_0023176 [Adiantum capillus-veneris]
MQHLASGEPPAHGYQDHSKPYPSQCCFVCDENPLGSASHSCGSRRRCRAVEEKGNSFYFYSSTNSSLGLSQTHGSRERNESDFIPVILGLGTREREREREREIEIEDLPSRLLLETSAARPKGAGVI